MSGWRGTGKPALPIQLARALHLYCSCRRRFPRASAFWSRPDGSASAYEDDGRSRRTLRGVGLLKLARSRSRLLLVLRTTCGLPKAVHVERAAGPRTSHPTRWLRRPASRSHLGRHAELCFSTRACARHQPPRQHTARVTLPRPSGHKAHDLPSREVKNAERTCSAPGDAPVTSPTLVPARKTMKVGIAVTPHSWAICCACAREA